MGKTQFHKDQLVDFRISADGPWIRGARYLHLVPGPESAGPDARVRVRAVSSLHFTPLLSDVRPMASATPLADVLGRVDTAQAETLHNWSRSADEFELHTLRELAEQVREHLMWCRELKS